MKEENQQNRVRCNVKQWTRHQTWHCFYIYLFLHWQWIWQWLWPSVLFVAISFGISSSGSKKFTERETIEINCDDKLISDLRFYAFTVRSIAVLVAVLTFQLFCRWICIWLSEFQFCVLFFFVRLCLERTLAGLFRWEIFCCETFILFSRQHTKEFFCFFFLVGAHQRRHTK